MKTVGRHFTTQQPFIYPPFFRWANLAQVASKTILEPFAGANHLVSHLKAIGVGNDFVSYDISPADNNVQQKDTLKCFPTGYSVCVTNPPWLAQNMAHKQGIAFPDCGYNDFYKLAINKCLKYCEWVAILIPESFIRTPLFRSRLTDFISMPKSTLFEQTGHPVGMALFQPNPSHQINIWSENHFVGKLTDLEHLYPRPIRGGPEIRFNIQDGNVGLYALDNHKGSSIRFCPPEELGDYVVKGSGRHVTKLEVNAPVNIDKWNDFISFFRNNTCDVFMTSYKGRREDGMYRRRMDWTLARGIIHHTL